MDKISHSAHLYGLTEYQIKALQIEHGKNTFNDQKSNRLLHTLWNVVKEPMFLMLVFACILYFILGEAKEGLMMVFAMFFVAGISFYQEVKSSKALAALRKIIEPKVKVLRDGRETTILSEDLLPGDVMLLEEGDRVPADAIVLEQNDMTVNESAITGESFPVEKALTDRQNQLFQGSALNSGKCYARVTAIGHNTVLGKLGKFILSITPSKTLLQTQIERFVKIMAITGLVFFVLIWGANYFHNGDVVVSLLFGLTLAMSIVPEEIPVAFSSFMALGAYRMAKLGIITRQPQTIENLGKVSVICLDKTGTITENKMEVKEMYDLKTRLIKNIDEDDSPNKRLLEYARLASEKDPFDAMEQAIIISCNKYCTSQEVKGEMIFEYPLEGKPPMMTHVYESTGIKIVAAKGAAERILRVCKMSEQDKREVKEAIQTMASHGNRVIAVCSSSWGNKEFPKDQDDFNWQFEGLLGLYDPPKKELKMVFDQWYAAGITIKLLTGDFEITAINIARETGIIDCDTGISGEEVMGLSKQELQRRVKQVNIFTRMFPDAKLRVIDALKANNEIVAMIGDGINDGPALRSSQIGIAMGDKGTEIAKEASDLIIMDDNLGKITDAIKHGRKISTNLKKAIRYIISIHIPIILTASLPILAGWVYPNIFTPIHIIFLELIMGPTCSIFFEREPVESQILNRPPEQQTNNVFSGRELSLSIVQGLMIAAGILSLYYIFMRNNYSLEYTRTMVFTTLIFSNVFLTFVNRSFTESIFRTLRYKNSLVPFMLIISALFLVLLYFVPGVRTIFGLANVSSIHFFTCIGVSIVSVLWLEVYKVIRNN